MNYLYHHVPKNLSGNILYALNDLKDKFPTIYENQAAKYTDRKDVMQQRIPLLGDCLWNDVLFMTSINPQELFDARRDAGWSDVEPQQYYKIDPRTLDESKLAVYLFEVDSLDKKSSTKSNDFAEYNYDDLGKYAVLSKATKDYYRHAYEMNAQRINLFYRYIPHILYRGEIDISGVEVITVR